MSIKRITQESVPCWYELSWSNKSSIILRIHEDFLKNKGSIMPEEYFIKELARENKFTIFEGDFEGGNFGFDKSFVNQGLNNGFFEMKADVPSLRKESAQPCSLCNGTGKVFDYGVCSFCGGGGKSWCYEWEKAFALSASFTVFFTFSSSSNIQTSSNLKQLMTIQTITKRDAQGHGSSLRGEFSALLVNWLRTIEKAETKNLINFLKMATAATFIKMNGRKVDEDSFEVTLRNGRLIINCPGDACGVHPENWHEINDNGYEFNCHNTDNPMQQIALLAGLAALHDEARKAGI